MLRALLSCDFDSVLCPAGFGTWCCVQDVIAEVKAEKAERARLGTGAPYQRTIP